MKILGSKFYGHDSAIAYIDTDSRTIFAISTERVTRIKHDWISVKAILDEYNIKDIDYVAHSFADHSESNANIEASKYGIRWVKFEEAKRKVFRPKYIKDLNKLRSKKYILPTVSRSLLLRPMSVASLIYSWLGYKFTKKINSEIANKKEVVEFISKKTKVNREHVRTYDHHLCHAVSAYISSPFKGKALSLTIDGHGDGFFSKLFLCDGNKQLLIGQSPAYKLDELGYERVTSLGELYGEFTEALGLRRLSEEGKVEALAAFSNRDEDLFNELMNTFKIENCNIFFNKEKVCKFYNQEALKIILKKIGREKFSATIQSFLEEVVVSYLNVVSEKYPGITELCLSGGVAANIIMNLAIYERTKFKNIYIYPAMGDEGTAVGAAALLAQEMGHDISWISEQYMPYYGDQPDDLEIKKAIEKFGQRIVAVKMNEKWIDDAAKNLFNGKIIGLFNGRMEFGPRALGNRTIAASPTQKNIKDRINRYVKRRPDYQPFCPSILEVERNRLFKESFSHKHMATAFRVKDDHREKIPSAIHVDGTARPQFVTQSDNTDYCRLIEKFRDLSGYGVIIDTSFNLHGRTIVRTPIDAITDFIDCNLDVLYMNSYKITKKTSPLL